MRGTRLLGIAVLTMALSPAGMAESAPTYVGGDCWRSYTPLWCRGTWQSGQFMHVYAIDHFSDSRPNWRSAFDASNAAWSSAAGPQVFSTSRHARDTWIFYEDSSTGRDQLEAGQLGLNWNCDYGGRCTPWNETMYVRFSSVKLNFQTLPHDSGTKVKSTFAHETGHALGLWHHTSSTDLMYGAYNGATTPSTANQGALPPCTGSTKSSNANNMRAGVRCVYNWKH